MAVFVGHYRGFASKVVGSTEDIKTLLEEHLPIAKKAIHSVPLPEMSVILEAYTPFSTYCKIKDLCHLATSSIIFVDTFLDKKIFYRYLRDIDISISVTLIGPRRRMSNEFLDISSLFAKERGSSNYRLITYPLRQLHDRWLQCDHDLYFLGNSSAQAAHLNDFTLAKMDSTPENLDKIQEKITNGIQQFGPDLPTHPQTRGDLL